LACNSFSYASGILLNSVLAYFSANSLKVLCINGDKIYGVDSNKADVINRGANLP